MSFSDRPPATRKWPERIAAALPDFRVEVHDVAHTARCAADRQWFLIMGIPTWDFGELQEAWERAWPDLADVDWSTKVAAPCGLGDPDGYPEWFPDALGHLWRRIVRLDAITVRAWPNVG